MTYNENQQVIEELMAESPSFRRHCKNYGTDYLAMPQWMRDRMTERIKAKKEVAFQMEFRFVQDRI